jgi:branched-chain amino acid transport system substrate-binding protein
MRFPRALGSIAVFAGLALAACGGGTAASSSPAAAPSSAPAKSSVSASAPASAAAKPATSVAASASTSAATASTAASASAKPAASTSSAAGPSGTAKTAKIGASFSLTGAGAPYGPVQKNAVLLAQDEINKANTIPGWQLSIDVEDDASDKTQVINVFQKFMKDNDVAIMGPTLSALALASDPDANSNKVPVLGVSTTADGITTIGDYIFRDSLSEAQVVPAMVKAVNDKYHPQKVAIMYANDQPFAKSGADALKQQFDSLKVSITDTETFGSSDKDFSAQLTKIKGTNPDAIFVSALADAGANIVSQARKLGIGDNVHIIGGNGMNSPQIAKIAGAAAEGVIVGAAWISTSTNPVSQQFVQNYKTKYNQDPDQFAAQAYAGTFILADALRRANLTGDTAKDRTAIRDALASTKNLPTVLGNFSFTSGRDADHPPVVQVIHNGQFQLFQ